MGFATWLKQNRLKRTERRLKTLRSHQRRVRERSEALAAERKKGTVTEDQFQAREAKLRSERDRLTHEVERLTSEEKRLRAELKAEDAAPA